MGWLELGVCRSDKLYDEDYDGGFVRLAFVIGYFDGLQIRVVVWKFRN